MIIPSASELDAWQAALKNGHAVTEMLPRFLEGYRRLLRVAEAASAMEPDEDYTSFDRLNKALDALRAPVPEETA